MLGKALSQFLVELDYRVIVHGRIAQEASVSCDATNSVAIREILDSTKPDVVINLVALTDVDRCEIEIPLAYKVNTQTALNLTDAIKQLRCAERPFLIHISTDHLYDSNRLSSEHQVKIQNHYSGSKYAADIAAMRTGSVVLRTNFFGKSKLQGRSSFSDWIVESLQSGQCIEVFKDVFFNPLSMNSLVANIEFVIRLRPNGIFNFGSHGGLSKACFALALAEELGFSRSLLSTVSVNDRRNLIAYRPRNMQMNTEKACCELGLEFPKLSDEIIDVARGYAS